MFKGFLFKDNSSKKDCCSITIEEVKDDADELYEASDCCEEQQCCCN